LVPDEEERAKWFTRGTDATREEWRRWKNNAPMCSVPIPLAVWLTGGHVSLEPPTRRRLHARIRSL
jgi:hypothetical protein